VNGQHAYGAVRGREAFRAMLVRNMARKRFSWRVVIIIGSVCAALVILGLSVSADGGERYTAPHSRGGAVRAAESLLGHVALPAGATRLAKEPMAARGQLSYAGPQGTLGPNRVDLHQWWRIPGTWRSVLVFVQAHAPSGSRTSLTPSQETYGGETEVFFTWPPSVGYIHTRQLIVAVAETAGHTTYVRLDALTDWLLPRTISELIPPGVHEVTVRRGRGRQAPSLSIVVTAAPKVQRIVAAVDRLPILQPGEAGLCRGEGQREVVTLVFRESGRGGVLAVASESANATGPTTVCDPMFFSIRGKQQTPLLEGPKVVAETERLLSVKLSR
jgi:hypothetical protein